MPMSEIIAPAPAPANASPGRGLAPGTLGPSLTLVRIDDRYVDYHEVVRPWLSIRRYAVIGLGVLVALFGGLAAWSVFAPLATGTIAHGVIGVESNRKTIQHLEGGIVRTIHVREGDRVTAGDPLVTLNDTQARSTAGVIRAKLLAAMAHEARLTAQRDGQAEIRFPAELMAYAGEPESALVLSGKALIGMELSRSCRCASVPVKATTVQLAGVTVLFRRRANRRKDDANIRLPLLRTNA
jgi:multidrug efflux pump subunit AcrA (membrane-fusion protein)